MPSKQNGTSTPSEPTERPNAFDRRFLDRLDEHDEPPHAGEADTAGPWGILEVPGPGFGRFREGEDPARGYRPYAVFHDRWLALIAAAVLPGTGRDRSSTSTPKPARRASTSSSPMAKPSAR